MTDLEQIKNKIDIVDFINGYVQLSKAGRNFRANCPFHKEDTPSFIVSPDKQIWHCFGCQKGGDIFGFLMEFEHIEFKDALYQLAEKAGVKIQKLDPKIKNAQDEVFEINDYASKFYNYILKSQYGKPALKYLKDRGVNSESIENFQIGFAPDEWDILSKKLVSKKLHPKNLSDSGLVILKDRSGYLDRFRNRIMFTIFNVSNKPVGFSGRIFDKVKSKTVDPEKTGKYINSPDSPIYNKSQILYGLNLAKSEIIKADEVIIVEGNLDLVMAHQAGFKNSIAVSGTALTQNHLEILERYTKNLKFAFDPDSAGVAAAKRSIDLAHQLDFNVSLIVLPSGLDPADLIKKDPEEFKILIKKAISVMDFYFLKIKEKYDFDILSSQDKKQIVSEIFLEISKVSNSVLQADYLRKLAELIKSDEKYVLEAFEKFKFQNSRFGQDSRSSIKSKKSDNVPELISRRIQIEKKIIGLFFAFEELHDTLIKNLKPDYFEDENHQKIAQTVQKLYNNKRKLNTNYFKKNSNLYNLVSNYSLLAESEYQEFEKKELEEEVVLYIQQIREVQKEKIKSGYAQMIKNAEGKGNIKELKKLLAELDKKIVE